MSGIGSGARASGYGSLPGTILGELDEVYERFDTAQLAALAQAVLDAPRVFVSGQGRSGLIAGALAMRLMHLGRDAHFVGEVTAPAVGRGDLFVALSASGTTRTTLHQAETAHGAGARVVAVTTNARSPLVALSAVRVWLPIGRPDGVPSRQHAGSLFEQAALVLADSLSGLLQEELGLSDAELDDRHDNLQ